MLLHLPQAVVPRLIMAKRSNDSNKRSTGLSKKQKKQDNASAPLISPSTTLYIKNLNTKININTLKRLLYYLFSTYGDVIEIVLNYKNASMRGQAHIIFGKLQSSINAMRSLQKVMVFDKALDIQYSKNVSKIVSNSIEEEVEKESITEAVQA